MNHIPNRCDNNGVSCKGDFMCFCASCEAGTKCLLMDLLPPPSGRLEIDHWWNTMKYTWTIRDSLEPIRTTSSSQYEVLKRLCAYADASAT